MLVYHRTHHSEAILREGFRDGYYSFGVDLETDEPIELRGVFVSADYPVDENEGADGDVVLELEIPDELWAEHEFNLCAVRILSDEEVDELVARRWQPPKH